MTHEEFFQVAAAIRTYYPKEQILPNQQAMELWYELLKDIPYDVASAVVAEWAANNKWSPAISDIRGMALKAQAPEIPEWSDAWEKVIQAIGRWGMHRESEALATMNETAQQTVKRMGWQYICLSENIGVERATFRDIYTAIKARKDQQAKLPESLAERIAQMQAVGIEVKDGTL
jgi:hypothetical protein